MSAPERIALTGLAPPFRGGIAHYTLHLGASLGRHASVRLFAWARQYPSLLFPGTSQHDPAPLGPSVETVRSLDPLRPWTWLETVDLVRRFGAVRLVHQWWHPWFAPATWSLLNACTASGIPVTVLCHNIEPHEAFPGAAAATRAALGPAERIIVHGQRDASTARKWWPGAEVAIHPHPPYAILAGPEMDPREARSRLGIDHAGPVVLFFGCVRSYKGLGDLVDAVPALSRAVPDVLVVVAGEFYDPRARYERRIEELGIRDRVHIEGRYIPNAEVGLWLRAASVVALPYRQATGSGVLPLARAAGVPVVSTRVGDLPDALVEGRDGLLVPPRDPAALAGAIARLIVHPPDGSAIARAAREHGWDGLARLVLGAGTG